MNKVTRIVTLALSLLFGNSLFAQSPTLQDFLKEPTLRDVELSPNGRYLAELWNKDGYRTITVKDQSLPDTPIVAQLADNIIRGKLLSWANNERLLVNVLVPIRTNNVRKRAKGNDDFDIDDYYKVNRTFAMDIDGKNIVALMEDQRGYRKNVSISDINNFLPNDSKSILINSYYNGKKSLFKVNIYTGKSELVVKGSKNT